MGIGRAFTDLGAVVRCPEDTRPVSPVLIKPNNSFAYCLVDEEYVIDP